MKGLFRDKKKFFEAFVDTMALSWDMHFFPQSLYCDGLFRDIHQYDFVGHMGPTLHNDIQEFAEQFGESKLLGPLEDAFEFQRKQSMGRTDKEGIEHNAAAKVQDYYTARSLRRVLEYVSIDYIHLNLSIPEWAQKLLDDDDTTHSSTTSSKENRISGW